MKKSGRMILIALIVLILIGLAVSAYFMFLYSSTCKEDECFSKALVACKRTTYINEGSETIMAYRILGERGNSCKIDVEMLQIKRGSVDLKVLEDKDMICYTPLGVDMDPESNIKECHGILKETIQEIMIARMHGQLIENIGEIGQEAANVL